MRNKINFYDVESLINEGFTYQQIADRLNVKRSSVGRFCRKHFGLLQDRGKSTRQSLPITDRQYEILFGSLLGDLCIAKHKKTFRGSITHSIKQTDYIQYLHNELSTISGELRNINVNIKDKVYKELCFTLRPNLMLKNLYNNFYAEFNGKKDVPFNLDKLTPLAIAIWFMDDGFLIDNGHSKTLGFSTCSFSLSGLLRLQEYLQHNYCINTIIRKNFYLVVKRDSYETLKNLISPYIIDSMKYKLG